MTTLFWMFDRLLVEIEQRASWRSFGILLLIYLVFAVFIMPMMINMRGVPADATVPLDLLLSYSPETANAHFQSLGEQGRRLSMWMHLSVDLVYPLVYASLFSVTICLLVRHVFANQKTSLNKRRLALMPLPLIDIDYLENFCLAYMAANWPDNPDWLARFASLMTTAKWFLVLAVIAMLLILLLLALLLLLSKSRGPGRPGG